MPFWLLLALRSHAGVVMTVPSGGHLPLCRFWVASMSRAASSSPASRIAAAFGGWKLDGLFYVWRVRIETAIARGGVSYI